MWPDHLRLIVIPASEFPKVILFYRCENTSHLTVLQSKMNLCTESIKLSLRTRCLNTHCGTLTHNPPTYTPCSLALKIIHTHTPLKEFVCVRKHLAHQRLHSILAEAWGCLHDNSMDTGVLVAMKLLILISLGILVPNLCDGPCCPTRGSCSNNHAFS